MTLAEWGIMVTFAAAVASALLWLRKEERAKDEAVREVADRVTQLEYAIFGVRGDNGLKATVDEIEAQLAPLPVRLRNIERDVAHANRNAEAVELANKELEAEMQRIKNPRRK